jgi:hypothetical protein
MIASNPACEASEAEIEASEAEIEASEAEIEVSISGPDRSFADDRSIPGCVL